MVSSGVQNEGEMTLRPIVKYDDVLPRGRKDIRKIIGFQRGRVTERRSHLLCPSTQKFYGAPHQ